MIRSRGDLYGVGMPAAPGQHYRAFIRFARRHIGGSALDLGCGFGAYGGELARLGVNCVGCDVNPEYLRTAAAGGLMVVQVGSTLPFADRSFDSVLMFEVVEHVEDLDRILSEAFRVARKNVLITVPNSEKIEQMKAIETAIEARNGQMLSPVNSSLCCGSESRLLVISTSGMSSRTPLTMG